MELQALSMVRPFTRVFERGLLYTLRAAPMQMFGSSESLLCYARCDHVDHAHMLAQLTQLAQVQRRVCLAHDGGRTSYRGGRSDKLRDLLDEDADDEVDMDGSDGGRSSLITNNSNNSNNSSSSSSSGVLSAAAGSDFVAYADLLPLRQLSRFLFVVQQFPCSPAMMRHKRVIEDCMHECVMHIDPNVVASDDCHALWLLLPRYTRWSHVEAMLRRFPLRSALDLQSHDEYDEVLRALCVCSFACDEAATTASETTTATTTTTTATTASGDGCAAVSTRAAEAHTGLARRSSHRWRFVHDVLGVDEMWQRNLGVLLSDDAAGLPAVMRERMAMTALHVSTVTHTWPCLDSLTGKQHQGVRTSSVNSGDQSNKDDDDDSKSTEALLWRQCLTGQCSASSSSSSDIVLQSTHVHTLNAVCMRVVTTLHPHIPGYVRRTVQPAAARDLLRVLTGADVDVTGWFVLDTLPQVQRQHSSLPVLPAMRACFAQAMRLHAASTSPSTSSSSSSSTATTTAAAAEGGVGMVLTREMALKMLLLSTHLQCSDVGAEADDGADVAKGSAAAAAAASFMTREMLQALVRGLHALLTPAVRTALRDGDVGGGTTVLVLDHTLDELWQRWSLLHTAYTLVVAERLLYGAAPTMSMTTTTTAGAATASTTATMLPLASRDADVRALCGELLEQGAAVLTPATLQQRASSRVVYLLLRHAPRVTRDVGAHTTCVALLREYAEAAFTRAQLHELLDSSQNATTAVAWPCDANEAAALRAQLQRVCAARPLRDVPL